MTARVVSLERDGADAARAELERCIADGGVAIFPADGVYGLACDPLREAAVRRIHELKGRGERTPSAVMYFSPLAMREVVAGLGPRTREAMAALLPGPVTLVVSNPERRFPSACREDPERLGLRLIEGPLAGVRSGVLQTSANPTGEPAPSRYEAIAGELIDGVDLAIDGGELAGRPSTVIDLSRLDDGGGWKVLREGALPAAEVERRLAAAGVGADGAGNVSG